MFDGDDADAVAAARERWSEAKAQGFEVTYWQPDEQGRWAAPGVSPSGSTSGPQVEPQQPRASLCDHSEALKNLDRWTAGPTVRQAGLHPRPHPRHKPPMLVIDDLSVRTC